MHSAKSALYSGTALFLTSKVFSISSREYEREDPTAVLQKRSGFLRIKLNLVLNLMTTVYERLHFHDSIRSRRTKAL